LTYAVSRFRFGVPGDSRADRRGNLHPAEQRPEQKIDAAVALMMAIRRAMAEDASEGDLEDFLRNPVIA
jgi:phage terminase large subunit-like protein